MTGLKQLWTGRMPPRDAFWGWLVARGLVVNLACTVLALVLVATAAEGAVLPLWLAVVCHLAAVPFNMVCVAGVWRSLERQDPSDPAATLLRAGSVALFVAYLVL